MKTYLETRIKQLKIDLEVYQSLDGFEKQIELIEARIFECELALDYYTSVCRS